MMSVNSSEAGPGGVGFVYNFKKTLYSSTQGLKKIKLDVNFQVAAPGINVNSSTINCRF